MIHTTRGMNEDTAEATLSLLKLKNSNSEKKNYVMLRNRGQMQVYFLQAVFDICRYPSTDTIENISILLQFSPRSIQIWFQNMRNNEKEIDDFTRNPNWIDRIKILEENNKNWKYISIWEKMVVSRNDRKDIKSRHLLMLYFFFFEMNMFRYI